MAKPSELLPGIRWGRALLGGLLMELILFGISGLFYGLGRAEELPRFVLPATAVAAVVAGLWVARRVVRVSGKDLFWYGAWTIDAVDRLRETLA